MNTLRRLQGAGAETVPAGGEAPADKTAHAPSPAAVPAMDEVVAAAFPEAPPEAPPSIEVEAPVHAGPSKAVKRAVPARDQGIRVFPLGGCQLHSPLNTAIRAGSPISLARLSRGVLSNVFSFGEMEQLINVLDGKIKVPQVLWPIAKFNEEFRVIPGAHSRENVDVVLVEVNTPIDIHFRSYYLNRQAVVQHILNPLGQISKHAKKRSNAWMNSGLLAYNQEVQNEAAAELISLMPEDMPNGNLIKQVLREARAERRDLAEGYLKLREMTGHCPMGVVVYVFQYLTDGRTITWPERFRDEVIEVATGLGLPIFDPPPHVMNYGLQAALTSDLRHYDDAFLPTLGAAMADFTQSVAGGARSMAAE